MAQNKAMDRAVQLLIEYADASDIEETVEYGKADYEPYEIVESLSHLNALIGKTYTMDEATSVMKRLGFKVRADGDNFITSIPSHRACDLKIQEDIDEEIVRLTNFDDLKSTLPLMPQTVGRLTKMQNMRRVIRDLLSIEGFYDTVNYTLVNEKYIEDACMPLGEAVSLLSPLSDARKYLRTSLMNSLLEALIYNIDHNNENIKLYEISKVYGKDIEQERLGIVLEGSLLSEKLKKLELKADFYTLKGIIVSLLNKLGFEGNRVQIKENTIDTKHFHPYQSAIIVIDNKTIGIFGKLHPTFLKTKKLSDVYYGELIISELENSKLSKVKSPIINKYPAISRDISILVSDDIKACDLISSIKKSGGNIVKNVEVFDVYQGEHIDKGYKSISLSITYEDPNKTLKVEDITPIHEAIVNNILNKFNATQR